MPKPRTLESLYYRRQLERGRDPAQLEAEAALEAKGMAYNRTNKGKAGRVHADSAAEVWRRMMSGEEGAGRGHRYYGGQGWNAPGLEGYRMLYGAGIERGRGAADLGRGYQQEALGLMSTAANGLGPSAATAMHAAGMGAATSNALGMAQSGRGNQALAMRQALGAQGAMSAQANLGAAQMRAQEMAAARSALAGAGAGYTAQGMSEQMGYENLLSQAELASLNADMGNRDLELRKREQDMKVAAAAAQGTADAIAAGSTGGASYATKGAPK